MPANDTSPIIPIGNKKYLCVEYPGYVKNTQRAIKTLGGENALAEGLASDRTVTINYRSGVTFTHPTNGYVLPSSKLLVKVTRRVKKNKVTDEVEAEDPNTPWKTEVLGTIPKTLRFRGKY
jgi:general transcription factor 3C polypeptide 5 (transcription factor C subunit 1)